MGSHESAFRPRLPAWLGQRPSAQPLLRSRLKLEVEHGRKGRGNSGLPAPLALSSSAVCCAWNQPSGNTRFGIRLNPRRRNESWTRVVW